MKRSIKVIAFVALVSSAAFVGVVFPYGQLTNDESGTVTGDHWELGEVLSDRTPGDGRTVIVHFGTNVSSSQQAAIMNSHDRWEGVVAVDLDDSPSFNPPGANLGDGFNTHQFNVILPGGALAVTPNITDGTTGRMLEADVYYSNSVRWDTSGRRRGRRVDVDSVAFHELGHFIGISHVGVTDATMFPAIQRGIESRSPEPDDVISPTLIYAQDAGDLPIATGGISGRVIDGDDATDGKVCALVFAFSESEEPIETFDQAFAQTYSGSVVGATVASQTSGASSGSYQIVGLPDDDYMVFLVPTGDGLINAGQVSAYCGADAEADFPREFWDTNESNNEADRFDRDAVTVSGGNSTPGIDFITETGAAGCTSDPDCDDGLFCNGAETCDSGTCQGGSDPCAGLSCDEATDQCVACGERKDSCDTGTDCCSGVCKRNGRCR